jgi:hypothetical protein
MNLKENLPIVELQAEEEAPPTYFLQRPTTQEEQPPFRLFDPNEDVPSVRSN